MKYNFRSILKGNMESISYLARNSIPMLLSAIFGIIITSVYAPLNLFLTSCVIDCVSTEGEDKFVSAMVYVSVIAILSALKLGWCTFYERCISPYYMKKLHFKVQKELFEKVQTMELSEYDNADFYNDFILAMQYTDSYIMGAVNNLSSLLGCILSFVAIFTIFFRIDFLCLAIILISSVGSLIINARYNMFNADCSDSLAPVNRRSSYTNRVFSLAEYAKELRLTHLSECLLRDYEASTKAAIRVERSFQKKKSIYTVTRELNDNLVNIAVVLIALYKTAVTKTISIGEFMIVINANWQLRNSLLSLSDFFSELPEQSNYIAKVRKIFDYRKNETPKCEALPFEKLEFRNVSFEYSKNTPVLQDVNFSMRKGDKIAIVGCNGSGKSTLIQLLCNLYTPQSGEILYNGNPLSQYNRASLNTRICAVFQDYAIFSATVAENVMADLYDPKEDGAILDALDVACFGEKLSLFPYGLQTILGREFDDKGELLSGGEEQKVAIARALFRKHDIVIMDEPLSALDPIAEYKLMQNVKKRCADSTVIYISHRLSVTVMCDRVLVMDKGQIIEQGAHDELMAQNGEYARLFNLQASKYV